MIRLEEKYQQAVQFRKRGFTYSEIAKIVDVSVSTLSVWLAKKQFSKQVKADNEKRAAKDNVKRIGLINKARKAERTSRYSEAVHGAETEYKHYKKDPLFIAGLMLYIGCSEVKKSSRIHASSSSFLVHKVIIHFLVEYLGANKEMIHFWLLLPEQKLEKKHIHLWSKKISLPTAQFYKTQFSQPARDTERSKFGSGTTLYNNTASKMKLLRWLELFEKDVHKLHK